MKNRLIILISLPFLFSYKQSEQNLDIWTESRDRIDFANFLDAKVTTSNNIESSSLDAEFYVSPDGNDDNTGTLSEPFFSLQRARDAAITAEKPVTIYLRGGTYYMDSVLFLGHEDSGEPGAPVIYSAYKDEKPVLSGAVRLEVQWIPYKGEIRQATVPPLNPKYPQLFVNGRRQILARYPNFNRSIAIFNGYSSDAFLGVAAGREPYAKMGAFLHTIMSTLVAGSLHYEITGIDQESGAFTLAGGYQVGFVNFPMDRFGVMGPDWEERRILIHKNVTYPGAGAPGPKLLPGAVITDITESIKNYTGLTGNNGVYLQHVPVGSGADSTGFMTGDVILAFNGDPVEDVVTFLPLFEGRPWGEIPIVVFRQGHKVLKTFTTPMKIKQPV